MEEALRGALLAAGERLADAVSKGLQARGLSADVHWLIDGLRVLVVSRSRDVHDAECGTSGFPPKSPMEEVARDEMRGVVDLFASSLENSIHERGL